MGQLCVDALHPSQQLFRHVGMISCFLELKLTELLLSRAKGHNTIPLVSLEPVTLHSQVLHSTTDAPDEMLHS